MSANRPIRLSTFSIVARDAHNGDLGVAVQSKFLAVGSLVPWAKAGVGAIATQSALNAAYGIEGLRLLANGWSAAEALNHMVSMDSDADLRQVLIVDAAGRAAAFTGAKCYEWAGHIVGEGYACAGNILVSRDTVEAMARTFETTDGPLAHRLVAALAAGQAAGGDRRGQQSAAVLVVRTAGGYAARTDRYVDLRVDDHPQPIVELQRLLKLHHLYSQSAPEDLIERSEAICRELQMILRNAGRQDIQVTGQFDGATRQALLDLYNMENLEDRWHERLIDKVALEYLRNKFL
ncbi:MAG: fimbrial assembly protein FimA [Ardenticatenia bacterium]|nr:MAG: fimbrial assembly protein FimA [Ardenticatenia bacterium]